MSTLAVLTAAGSGSRLGVGVPKALVELRGTPLVVRAARGLVASGSVDAVVVTASPAEADRFAELFPGGRVPAEAASQTLLKEQLADVLKTLTPREEKVLRLRFGLEDGRPRTLEEVGKEFNVTRERIRQIEAKALRKLRHPSRSKKLRDFLD